MDDTTDWEAVAADQALTIALLNTDLDRVKAYGVIHQVIACDFAEMLNPENKWIDFTWEKWQDRMQRKIPEMRLLYGLKCSDDDAKEIVREFTHRLLERSGFKRQ